MNVIDRKSCCFLNFHLRRQYAGAGGTGCFDFLFKLLSDILVVGNVKNLVLLLNNAKFIIGDFTQGVSENVLMIKPQCNNNTCCMRNSIGGVPSATEADFVNGVIHRIQGEKKRGGKQSETLEVRKIPFFDQWRVLFAETYKLCVRNRSAVHANSLCGVYEMWGCVKADFFVLRQKKLFQGFRRGAFAVGSGNVDNFLWLNTLQ